MLPTPFLVKDIQGRTSIKSQNYKSRLSYRKKEHTNTLTYIICMDYSTISVKVITREDTLIKKWK
jgi:hypothetical protein